MINTFSHTAGIENPCPYDNPPSFPAMQSAQRVDLELYDMGKCCETCSHGVTARFVRWAPNGKKWGKVKSNPWALAYRASDLNTGLMEPDILTYSHTPVYPVTKAREYIFLIPSIPNLSN